MDAPDWLTKEFLEKLLEDNQEHPKNKVTILKYETLLPFPRGTSHLSTIFRANIEYKNGSSSETNKISLIIKIPIVEGDLAPFNEWGVFQREVEIFKELVPKLQSVMRNSKNYMNILPKSYKTNQENTVILEDLSESGYKMGDRLEQLDYEHSSLVIKCLAKFHAACIRLHEIEPEIIDKFGIELLYKVNMDEGLKKYMDPMTGGQHIEMICREFEKWPETKEYVGFLTKIKPKVWDIFLSLTNPSDGEFTTLNHGDLWSSNILFTYDENQNPQYLKFIDFQMTRSTSPTVDILHFFHTSVRYEVLKIHFNDLINTYLEHLNQNLEDYGSSKRLLENDFRKALEKREIFGLMQSINLLPYLFAEFKAIDENGKAKDISLPDYLKSERYRSVCAKFLEEFSKKSWFQNFE